MNGLLNDFEHMMHRAERNAKLFHGVAWQAHLETLQVDELPDLELKRQMVEYNMQVFAGEPDEMERLEDVHEYVKREIAYLTDKQAKGKK